MSDELDVKRAREFAADRADSCGEHDEWCECEIKRLAAAFCDQRLKTFSLVLGWMNTMMSALHRQIENGQAEEASVRANERGSVHRCRLEAEEKNA